MNGDASLNRCDVVIPVYNALRSTRNGLESARRNSPSWARIVVINDGSDARTTEWLREQEGIVLLENPVNLGFVKSANRGLLFSNAPYVCLLNSDTLLTPGAVERMVARMDADRSIGLACPLSNGAVNLSVKLPPGEDVFSFARRVARTSPARTPDAVTVVGFCLFVRREVIDTLGVFDEVFDRGYCEETDLHYRARNAGWRCVVADDVFVYHRQGASFSDGNERMNRNLEILMKRWGPLHAQELAEFNRKDELGAVRDATTFEWTLPDDRPAEPFDALFVLPMMGVFGGVADVLELVNALVLEGKRAGVVLLGSVETEIDLELLFRPLRIPAAELAEKLPKARVLVATSYETVVPVAAAAARHGTQTAYFVQDYEGWFGDQGPDYVSRTYDLIPRMTAISTWLSEEIRSRHGHAPSVVPMSADPETFYPRERTLDRRIRVAAMLRPDERRGIRYLLPALATVAKDPRVEVVLFGSHPVPREAEPFPHRHEGVLSRDGVARLLGTADVVVDPSLFQGFGLVGLEGMASGAAAVLTDSGGIREYAVDGENALIVPSGDASALAAAVLRVVNDDALRSRLARAGLATARRFTWRRTARIYIDFLDSLPPPVPPSPGERAALELLYAELCHGSGRTAALEGEVRALRNTLHTIYRSTVWKALSPYWKLKGVLKR